VFNKSAIKKYLHTKFYKTIYYNHHSVPYKISALASSSICLAMLTNKRLYNPVNAGNFCHCPTLLETQSNDLFVTWYAYPENEYAEASIVIARQSMSNKNWSPSKVLIHPTAYSNGNPLLFQDPTGRIHLMFVVLKGIYWNHSYIKHTYSDDNGISWSTITQIFNQEGMMIRHPPLLLDDGSYLLPAYNENARESILLKSFHPYTEWKQSYKFDNRNIIQSTIIKEGSGRLTLFFRPHTDPRRIWQSFSPDQGRFWSNPRQTLLPNPLSGISAFTVNDNIVMIYNPTEGQNRFPLSSSISRDGGFTWEEPEVIDNSDCEVSYPSFYAGKNQKIHGVYTHNRQHIQYVQLDSNKFY